jgi:predicted Zn finger-like uncharacterized protein
MLLNCNSCQKKFVVPDSAITKSGRLVQCGSCGNKWNQYPVEKIEIKKTKPIQKTKSYGNKNTVKKPKTKKNLYTAEYLKKKHGLDLDLSNNTLDLNASKIRKKDSFGFYSYLIVLFVFLTLLFGVLNSTKELIVLKYPSAEIYIDYLYEVIDIIKIFLNEFINQFSN